MARPKGINPPKTSAERQRAFRERQKAQPKANPGLEAQHRGCVVCDADAINVTVTEQATHEGIPVTIKVTVTNNVEPTAEYVTLTALKDRCPEDSTTENEASSPRAQAKQITPHCGMASLLFGIEPTCKHGKNKRQECGLCAGGFDNASPQIAEQAKQITPHCGMASLLFGVADPSVNDPAGLLNETIQGVAYSNSCLHQTQKAEKA